MHGTEVEESGRWYFRRDILERLDSYFEALRLLRKVDDEAYDLHARIGGTLIPGKDFEVLDHMVEAEGLLALPPDQLLAAGCMIFKEREPIIDRRGKQWIAPMMAVFYKYNNSPPSVEYYNGPLYSFSFVYHSHKYKRMMAAGQFPIAVIHDGGVMLQQQRRAAVQHLPQRGRNGHRYGRVSIRHHQWAFNPNIGQFCQDHGLDLDEAMQMVLDDFQRAYALAYHAQADTRVMVTRGNLTASFGIDMMRLPYFFSDRDRAGRNARRRAIFHIVRPHLRQGGSVVHSHVRGERDFCWHGDRVHITLPGRHHSSMGDLTMGAYDVDDLKRPRTHYIDIRQFGIQLAQALRA